MPSPATDIDSTHPASSASGKSCEGCATRSSPAKRARSLREMACHATQRVSDTSWNGITAKDSYQRGGACSNVQCQRGANTSCNALCVFEAMLRTKWKDTRREALGATSNRCNMHARGMRGKCVCVSVWCVVSPHLRRVVFKQGLHRIGLPRHLSVTPVARHHRMGQPRSAQTIFGQRTSSGLNPKPSTTRGSTWRWKTISFSCVVILLARMAWHQATFGRTAIAQLIPRTR